MSQIIKLIVFPAKDLEMARTFYTDFLEVEPYADSQYYVGYKTDDLEFGLDPYAKNIIIYKDVDDIKECIEHCLAHGCKMHEDSKDVGGGLLIAQLKDPNGNIFGVRQVRS